MKLYNIVLTRKGTEERSILSYGITEAQAERECEQWGWSYDDGKHSYYMSYEETELTEEMKDLIENSKLSDLYDAYDIEEDPEIKEIIKAEIKARLQ